MRLRILAHWSLPDVWGIITLCQVFPVVPSLKLTTKAPENRPFNAPKGNDRASSNHPFSGANLLLVSGRVAFFLGQVSLSMKFEVSN